MYKVLLTQNFKKEAKSLIKKYASIREELAKLGEILAENPTSGTPLGRDCYKVRLAIKSKNKGKSGGARIITYVISSEKEVVLLTIYDKNTKANLRPNELDYLLKNIE